jgi:alginate O-acetyltransferase complex protein AlgI
MLFNSFEFGVFLVLVFVLHWILPHRLRSTMLVAASYFFYGYWDWRFLSLILASTFLDFITGLKIYEAVELNDYLAKKRKKRWLILSLCGNLGILGIFKYYDFFIGSFENFVSIFGFNPTFLHLNLVLPVGISFYTFQTMSYSLDIYRGDIKPTHSFWDFALFVSFFPHLVAGPIERARNMLPQIIKVRQFSLEKFKEGTHLIFWGFFKKVYVADNLSIFVNRVFDGNTTNSYEIIFATYAFAFQIYCDFSGYSSIARGCAKCLGIELMKNFNFPYSSTDIREFWQRWHISLSTWLRDYLYVPLGGNRRGTLLTYRNLALTMLLCGLWHGANWTFVLWGAFHAVLLLSHRVMHLSGKRVGKESMIHYLNLYRIAGIFITFNLVCVGWLIFRCQSLTQLGHMLSALWSFSGAFDWTFIEPLMWYALPMVLVEAAFQIAKNDYIFRLPYLPTFTNSAAYAILFYLLAFHGAEAQSFIYFQF